jgi:hypothetical protein
MEPDATGRLREHRDFYSLTKGVLALCEPFGPVHAFRFVHNRGASRVACFIELESPKQQPALARALGGRAINGAVCLEIPVGKEFGSASKVVPLPGAFEARIPAVPPRPTPAISPAAGPR